MSAPTMRLAPVRKGEFPAAWGSRILALVLAIAGVWTALRAYSKPFWFDEICTVTVCRLADNSAIWRALEDAVDTNPPIYYMIARLARQIVPEDHLGYRLPSILGLMMVCICLYAFLARRVDRLAALVGAAFALFTVLSAYAFEARPYALLLGFLATAMLAWQRIDDSKMYAALMAVFLAGAVSVHYYAILAWPAFLAAEAVVWWLERRFRLHAWAAFLVAALPLVVFSGLLLKLKSYYGQNFWASPSLGGVLVAYDSLLNGARAWGLAFVLAVTGVFAYWWIASVRAPSEHPGGKLEVPIGEGNSVPVRELVLFLVLLWLPVISFLVAKATGGGMTDRYVMPLILGASVAAGFLASKAQSGVRLILVGILVAKLGLLTAGESKRLINGSMLSSRNAVANELDEILRALPPSNVPVVISSGLQYFAMTYYTPLASKSRIHMLVDPPAAVKYAKSDSIDLALIALGRYTPLQVEEYPSFATRHSKFLMISDTDAGNDWWSSRLTNDGHAVTLLLRRGRVHVYEVRLKS